MRMYSLAILMKYFLTENKLSEFWVVTTFIYDENHYLGI